LQFGLVEIELELVLILELELEQEPISKLFQKPKPKSTLRFLIFLILKKGLDLGLNQLPSPLQVTWNQIQFLELNL
jgi:hypothetical protein